MLELRCPRHPEYNGARKPGDSALIVAEHTTNDPARGSQACRDCWEVYRRAHEEA